jgi:hypothetical protein
MKKITTIIVASTLLLGAYAVQAHVTKHDHQYKMHSMSSAGGTNVEQMNHNDMSNMSEMKGHEAKHDHQYKMHSMSSAGGTNVEQMNHNDMSNMSEMKGHAKFEYMDFDEQDKHSFFEYIRVMFHNHSQQEQSGYDDMHGKSHDLVSN